MIERSQRHAARAFAITTLLMYIVLMFAFNHYYGPFLVWEHDAETARNFFAHEQLLHFYLIAAVFAGACGLMILSTLYVVFRPVSRGWALLGAGARLVYAVMWFIGILDLFSALRFMEGGGLLQGFGPERLQALAGFELASGWDAYYIGLTFYAIGSLIFSYLFFKSRYVPPVLAAFGILASLFELVCGFSYLVDRNFNSIVSVNYYELPPMLFEAVLCLWILIRGLRPLEPAKPAHAKN